VFVAGISLMALTVMSQGQTTAARWSIGDKLQLRWNGADYTPVGLQVGYDKRILEQANEAGIRDYNVEVSANTPWNEVAQQLEGRRFFITLNSAAPSTKGVTVQPQFYRINDILGPQKVTLNLPGSQKAYVVVALKRDGSIVSQKLYPVEKGVLKADIKAVAGADQIGLVYPIGESLEMEDLWERLDERRDLVLRQLRNLGTPAGLRGIINPLGSTPFLASKDAGFVPTSAIFRQEFADFLEEKYRNLQTLGRSWGMLSVAPGSFSEVASLTPLWNAQRGVPLLLNIDTSFSYPVESKKSAFWRDLAESISRTRIRRVHRILRAFRKSSSVPILQDWTGWSWFFENPENELTGLSVRLSKFTPSGLMSATAGALSSNLRSRRPGPVLAVDVPFSPELLSPTVLEDISNFGLRGLFIRSVDPTQFGLIAKMALPTPDLRPQGIYYPVNAMNPAFPQRLASSLWWLPSPRDGNRIDLGPNFSAYSMSDGPTPSYMLWSNGNTVTTDFRLSNPLSATFRSFSGLAPNAALVKKMLKVTVGPTPILVTGAAHCPVPESELIRLQTKILSMIDLAISRRVDVEQIPFELRGLEELMNNSPDKALALLQKIYYRLAPLLAGAVWIEAESSPNHSFSENSPDPGCSNNQALTLRTPLAEQTGATYAIYQVPQRGNELMNVWVSARIPNNYDRSSIKFKIGGQTLVISGKPISIYGNEFGWYQLGTTRLPSVRTEMKVEIAGNSSTNLSLDSFLFTPQPFQPNNVRIPDFYLPEPPKEDPTPGSKKGSGGL
jgi:hypothetical protein